MSNSNKITIRREMSSYNVARELLISLNAYARVKGLPFDPGSVRINKKKPRVFIDFDIDPEFDPQFCQLLLMAEAACGVLEATSTK